MGRKGRALRAGVLAMALAAASRASAADGERWLDAYRADSDRIVREALASRVAWERLTELTDSFGHRLSGSRRAARLGRQA